MSALASGKGSSKDRLTTRVLRIYRSGKRKMFAKTRLGYERFKQFFLLPTWYHNVRAIQECRKSRTGLALDLLSWFFSYKMLPTHYGRYRLWEVDRKEWKYYYGSNYLPHQQARLRKTVQPLEYRILFNDKYICVLLCQALGIRVPRTLGTLDPAHNYKSQIAAWLASSPAGKLIIKPLRGETGRDIVLAEPMETGIFIRSLQTSTPLHAFMLREKAIVQDVLSQDSRMATFSSCSVNTMRVVTMIVPQDDIIVVNAALRTGTGRAFVDNWSAGGVAAGIDCTSGRLKKYAYDKKTTRYTAHPTSGVVFENYPVPEWDHIRDTAVRVQRAFPLYRMLGLDIALDQNGEPVVIEINHGPDMTFLEQTGGPVLKIEPALRAFGEYNLLVNRHQRRLYAEMGAH
jgi:glutathione synthase/RimK-type ligase-like ATP-grasp enzyme